MVAVVRRGPSEWCQVGRWDLDALRFEPGSWFRGTLYPQRCDLSPDGRWLAYTAMDYGARWEVGPVYEAVSRLPWLHALAAWGSSSTYIRGFRFIERPGVNEMGEPDLGDPTPCLARYGLRPNRATQFAVERRRGWAETEDTPPRSPKDTWDELRDVRMVKTRPGGPEQLVVEGSWAAFRDNPDLRSPARYALVSGGETHVLSDLQWADWDVRGRLLAATIDGCIEVRVLERGSFEVAFSHDLASAAPDPQPPPSWAREW